jgi:hypothetical protein
VVRAVRSARDAAPRDLLAHVRLHVGRQALVVERYLLGPAGDAPVRALRGRVRVEVQLAAVWPECSAVVAGARVPPSALQDCAWAAPAVAPAGASAAPASGAERAGEVAAGVGTLADAGDGGEASGGAMLVALDTKVLRIAPAAGSGGPGRAARLQEDLMGVRKERWTAEALQLPVAVAVAPLQRKSFSGAPSCLAAFGMPCCC